MLMLFSSIDPASVDAKWMKDFSVLTVISFGVALVVSWKCVDGWIQKRHDMLLKRQYDPEYDGNSSEIFVYSIKNSLLLGYGAEIGRIERCVYLATVFVDDYSLIGGWLVLKAFFGWIKSDAFDLKNVGTVGENNGVLNEGCEQGMAKGVKSRRQIIRYYLYIYGSCLSLLCGIGSGFGARLLERVLASFCKA